MKCDDHRIEQELALLKNLARQHGHETVKAAVIDRMVAMVLWLDSSCGERQTYDLVQSFADRLVEQGPRVAA